MIGFVSLTSPVSMPSVVSSIIFIILERGCYQIEVT